MVIGLVSWIQVSDGFVISVGRWQKSKRCSILFASSGVQIAMETLDALEKKGM